jgi:ATP-dependent Clp protease, protease subunit
MNETNVKQSIKKDDSLIRLITLFGEIEDTSVKDVVSILLKEQKKDIILAINSPGGSIDAGRAVIDAIQWCRKSVYTLAIGGCYSMAFQILLYGKKRFSTPFSTFMYHDTKYDFSRYIHPNDVTDVVDIQKKMDKELTDDMIALTKLTKNEIESAFKNRKDSYLDVKEALKKGVIDYIVKNEDEVLKIIGGNNNDNKAKKTIKNRNQS